MNLSATLQHTVPTPHRHVYTALRNFKTFAELHPLMINAEEKTKDEFIITEKMQLPFGLSTSFKYLTRVIEQENGSIKYSAKPVIMKLDIVFSFTQNNTNTIVHEQIEIGGPRLFAGMLKKLLSESHDQLFKNLADRYCITKTE